MSEPLTMTECGLCGYSPKAVSDYCPECGAEEPWEEVYKYDWEEVDLPVVFSNEAYNDDYGLWRSFCSSTFGVYELKESQIANAPEDIPKMKYRVVQLYYKLDEDLELHGPFLERQEARDA